MGHDCRVEEGAFITARVEMSGSVRIGGGTRFAPGRTILDGVRIGSDCLVKLGPVVAKSLPDASKAGGNPAVVFPVRRQ